jgi:hypothetical protein
VRWKGVCVRSAYAQRVTVVTAVGIPPLIVGIRALRRKDAESRTEPKQFEERVEKPLPPGNRIECSRQKRTHLYCTIPIQHVSPPLLGLSHSASAALKRISIGKCGRSPCGVLG